MVINWSPQVKLDYKSYEVLKASCWVVKLLSPRTSFTFSGVRMKPVAAWLLDTCHGIMWKSVQSLGSIFLIEVYPKDSIVLETVFNNMVVEINTNRAYPTAIYLSQQSVWFKQTTEELLMLLLHPGKCVMDDVICTLSWKGNLSFPL